MRTYGIPGLMHEWETFRTLPERELLGAVMQVLERARADPELLDFDRLMGFGIGLRGTAVPTWMITSTVIDWAGRAPTERSLGAAAAFLSGLWTWNTEPLLAKEEDIERYINLICQVSLTGERGSVTQSLRALIPLLHGAERERTEICLRDLACLGDVAPRQ